MASGFIGLPDGSNWSSRWSRYDWVLETIMNELSDDGDEAVLKGWLKYIIPSESDEEYVESGYCFYKNKDECILRIIDTRWMKDKYFNIFWNTVGDLSNAHPKDSDIGYLVNETNAFNKV